MTAIDEELQAPPGDDAPRSFDRNPPQNLAAEMSVLGGVLMSPAALDSVIDRGLTGRDFYRPAHEAVWEAVEALHRRQEPVDATTVHGELLQRGDLNRIGGAAYLHKLLESVPTAANAGYYATEVRDRAVLRRLVAAGTKVVQLGQATDGGQVSDIVDAAVGEVLRVSDDRDDGANDDDLIDAVDESIDELQHGTKPRTPTGISGLDDLLNGGLLPGTVTTIGARPSVGKTLVGRQILLNVGVDQGLPCGYSSLEMSRQDLILGAYACLGRVDYGRLQRSPKDPLTEPEWRAVDRAAGLLRQSQIRITDDADLRVGAVRAGIRRMIRKRGSCALWVVDYLQLLTPDDDSVNREQQVARIMRSLKLTALSLKVPIILLAQLKRDPETSKRNPILSDLRESGAVEQDSDTVILLDRNLKDSPTDLYADVAKNRRGLTSTTDERIKLEFVGHYQQVRPPSWSPSSALLGGR